jgi:hypothetical protein
LEAKLGEQSEAAEKQAMKEAELEARIVALSQELETHCAKEVELEAQWNRAESELLAKIGELNSATETHVAREDELKAQLVEWTKAAEYQSAREAELKENFALLEQAIASKSDSGGKFSARVLNCQDLEAGIEAWEMAGATGDATDELEDLVAKYKASQAYLIGRMVISATGASSVGPVPVSKKVTVANTGGVVWPVGTILMHKAGPVFELPTVDLGALQPGQATDAVLDLKVPLTGCVGTSRSLTVWAVVDPSTGESLGPILCFEVFWE